MKGAVVGKPSTSVSRVPATPATGSPVDWLRDSMTRVAGVGSSSSGSRTVAVTTTPPIASAACATRVLSDSPSASEPAAVRSSRFDASSATAVRRQVPAAGAVNPMLRAYDAPAASEVGPASAARRTKPGPSVRVA